MISHTTDPDLSKLLACQEAISGLVKFSKEILGQTNGLLNVVLLSRPEQHYPDAVRSRCKSFSEQLAGLELTSLIDVSRKDEKITNVLMQELTSFIQDTPNMVKQKNWLLPNSVKAKVKAFDAHSSRAVMSRILLQNEGIVISPAKFFISAEILNEYFSTCRAANKKLVNIIVDELTDFISRLKRFINKLRSHNRPTESLKAQTKALESGLAFAKVGELGNLEKSLDVLESELSSSPRLQSEQPETDLSLNVEAKEASIHKHDSERTPSIEIAPATTEERTKSSSVETLSSSVTSKLCQGDKNQGFMDKCKTWLNTGWDTKWREI